MKFRFFFDYGGDCLWAADDEAREKCGYPVDLDALPLSGETRRSVRIVTALFDGLMESDGDEQVQMREEFVNRATKLYAALVSELGVSIEIIDEMNLSRYANRHTSAHSNLDPKNIALSHQRPNPALKRDAAR